MSDILPCPFCRGTGNIQPPKEPEPKPKKPRRYITPPVPKPKAKRWCEQCEMQMTDADIARCGSRFCALKKGS